MNLKEREELLIKVEKAKEQIAKLRSQQTELEREKAELEELRDKQEEWNRGKKEIGEALLRAITVLQSEESDVHRMSELIRNTREILSGILDELRAVKEERWTPSTLKEDLTRALLIIQKGRKEISKAIARIPALDEKHRRAASRVAQVSAGSPRSVATLSPGELLKIGFWLALPFAIMLLIILLVFSVT